jgi:serine/threonine protein kinase
MICCLNPACHNPPASDSTQFCPNCGVPLVVLRNRYRPVKSLGGGGFGKTYLAEDIDKLNQKCVIKQLAPQVQGTGALQKATELFAQEARRLEQLGEHPQIPTLLAYFQEDGRLYLVQQFIDGQNLLDVLKQDGNFTEQKIRELLLDLLDILKTVHQQQVIHRDIKPENIIQRGDGKVVLIDFGASKQLTTTIMTAPGTTIGSFGYAPLEQMQEGEAYPASDLFSLGATCFHLLSGIHPWQLWKSQGYSWVKSWREHLQQQVSQELGQIIDKLLQEDYQQRYKSVEAVLEDLHPQAIPATLSVVNNVVPKSPLPKVITSLGIGLGTAIAAAMIFLIFLNHSNRNATAFPELAELLKAGQWKQADRKTAQILLQATNRSKEGFLEKKDIEKLSCDYIVELDNLWLKYSNNKFGFSVQKQIYQTTGSIDKFGDVVGWRSNNNWLKYQDLNFSLQAPSGHLPSIWQSNPEATKPLSGGWIVYNLLSPKYSQASNCLHK